MTATTNTGKMFDWTRDTVYANSPVSAQDDFDSKRLKDAKCPADSHINLI